MSLQITDGELHTALAVLAAWRDAALQDRAAKNLPAVIVYEGEAEPEGADGDLMRVGSLIHKLQSEAIARDLQR